MGRVALRVRISGRVQGVGFRAWTVQEARALGLEGWVRNERDGSVSALIAGTEAAVAQMVGALNAGPALARVESVRTEITREPAGPGFDVTG